MEKKKRLRLKTEKIDGEEMVVMECATCHRRENVEADIAFECWEFDGRAFSRVRLSVLRDGTDDSEAGDRGNEGRRRKRKAPGQTEKKKKLNIFIRL